MGFENLPKTTADLAQEQLAKLRALFPECVTESERGLAVDFDLLRRALSPEAVIEGPNERYRLEWPGKRAARYAANAPTASTLRPVRERSKDFDTTQNLYVEGDNLEALKLLRTAYAGKVKLIYIDPPYNTGHDFIYHDKYVRTVREEMDKAGLIDDEGRQTEDKDPFQKNDETNGRYHSDWLTMMYPRLLLARDLLTDDGVIFISIDDNEQANLKRLCDEIFGAGNFIAQITIVSTPGGRDYGGVAKVHEYLLAYGRNQEPTINLIHDAEKFFTASDDIGGFEARELRNRNIKFNSTNRPNLYYPFYVDGNHPDSQGLYPCSLEKREGWVEVWPLESRGVKTVWRWGKALAQENLQHNVRGKKKRDGTFQIIEKYREERKMSRSLWDEKEVRTEAGSIVVKDLFGYQAFDYPKPIALVRKVLEMSTASDDIVLDFFSGSGTTAHAVMALNAEDGGKRQFILVQLPEQAELGTAAAEAGFANICEIGEERIRRAGEKILGEHPELRGTLDVGFRVLRLDEKNERETAQTPDDSLANWEAALAEGTVKPGRTEEDLLFQALLRVTEPLLVERIEREVMAGLTVWSVADGFVVACLVGEGQLTAAKAEAVTRWIVGQAVSPSYVAFREAGFADDSVKLNVEAGLRQAGCKATLWVL